MRSRTTAQTQQSSFEDDKERLLREQAAARHRLEALNGQLDAATQDRDAFELEASKAKRELSLVQEERSVLQVWRMGTVWEAGSQWTSVCTIATAVLSKGCSALACER